MSAESARKTRVLIIDDSALVRGILRAALSTHPQIEVVGLATDGVDAIRKIKALRPEVCTLDVEMPRLNGIAVLERAAGKVPVGFVMVSTLTQAGARITFEALQKGAFDYITKPAQGGFGGDAEFRTLLQEKVLTAAKSRGRRRHIIGSAASAGTTAPSLPPNKIRGWVVGIGISCGGPQTLTRMLPAFPSDFAPIVVTQHMPAEFTPSFASHLDNACSMSACEAADGDRLRPGTIYVAPGSHHMKIDRQGVELVVRLDGGRKVSGHRPSADVMFGSLARACGPRAVGVVMTGMGEDGAAGMSMMHRAGAWTIAQDETTSLVYGMPKAAVATGDVDHVLALDRIPLAVSNLMGRGARATAAST